MDQNPNNRIYNIIKCEIMYIFSKMLHAHEGLVANEDIPVEKINTFKMYLSLDLSASRTERCLDIEYHIEEVIRGMKFLGKEFKPSSVKIDLKPSGTILYQVAMLT